MSLIFIKNCENFTCEHCGRAVTGNGYTNHCPACLWSKHLDINPGDRAAGCGGLMPPLTYERKNGGLVLIHRCQKCQHIKRNKTCLDDDIAPLVELC